MYLNCFYLNSIIRKLSFLWPFKYQISDKLKNTKRKKNKTKTKKKCKKPRVLLNTAYSTPVCFSLIVEELIFTYYNRNKR